VNLARIGAAVVVAGAVALAVLRPRRVVVDGPSMEPTLMVGDRLLVLRRPPGPGQVVALRDPDNGGRLLVKRIVSVEGEAVVVEGDNGRASRDSRTFGPVDRRAVVGRAVYRYFPPHRAGPLGSGALRQGPGRGRARDQARDQARVDQPLAARALGDRPSAPGLRIVGRSPENQEKQEGEHR
jgi:nickel-type superoxide dismutase maturation protease